MSKKKFGSGFVGKGYYIALILCAVAIGISGYLYYAGVNEEVPGGEDISVVATNPSGTEELPPVGTQPSGVGIQSTVPTKEPVITTKPIQTASPVQGQVVAVYSMDALDYNPTTRDWRVHDGLDIAAEEGTQVCAAAAGTVYTVYEDETMGTTVVIRHEQGYVTCYASLSEEVLVQPGDPVTLGQPIGTVGTTALLESAIGHHVHFSVTCDDEPVDPADFLTAE
jgi:murein DD-endopeptidase MepM/ murein hydrolase activator NlpD